MKKAITALLALASTTVVEAQLGTTAYYGIALGSFDYEENANPFFSGYSDKVDSWRAMVGYQFNEHLAVEGGYGKTSTIVGTAVGASPIGDISFTFRTEFKSLMVRLLGVLPFDNGVSLLGGIGYADGEEDFTVDISGLGQQSSDVSFGEPTLFAGAQYDWDRVALRLGWEKYDFEGDRDASEVSLSFFYKL
jgi:hypothetical protein